MDKEAIAGICEAPLFAGRETLPPLWDDRLPRLRGPREPGGHWPRTVTEWADQLAQAELEESERRARQRASNRTVIRPTAIEIQRMDAAFEWLRELRSQDSGMALITKKNGRRILFFASEPRPWQVWRRHSTRAACRFFRRANHMLHAPADCRFVFCLQSPHAKPSCCMLTSARLEARGI